MQSKPISRILHYKEEKRNRFLNYTDQLTGFGICKLLLCIKTRMYRWGFPGGTVVENLPANAGDTGSSPGLGGSHMPWSN